MRLSVVASSALTLFGLAQAIDHIPYPCHGTYQVVEGDTCQSIAALAGTDVPLFNYGNKISRKTLIVLILLSANSSVSTYYSASIAKRDHIIKPVRGGSTHVDVAAAKKGKKHHTKKGKKYHVKKPVAAKRDYFYHEPVRGGSTHIDTVKEPVRGGSTHVDVVATK